MDRPQISRVVVVDDSATARSVLSRALRGEPDIEVVAEAADAFSAQGVIARHRPDVVTLDLAMPRMDGLAFLRHLMKHDPLPVIVISAHTTAGSVASVEALRAGAIDVMSKPHGEASVAQLAQRLKRRIRELRTCPVRLRTAVDREDARPRTIVPPWKGRQVHGLIAIGASTGGPQAVEETLMQLPSDSPPVVIVQHMPAPFTALFAKRLNEVCAITVHEAADQTELARGVAYIAPGGHHLLVKQSGDRLRAVLDRGPHIRHQRPSVDVLFQSLVHLSGVPVVAVLLTGMGDDGAAGMVALRGAGQPTIAEDERSCVVFGMPREAIARGGASHISPLEQIPTTIFECLDRHADAAHAAIARRASSIPHE